MRMLPALAFASIAVGACGGRTGQSAAGGGSAWGGSGGSAGSVGGGGTGGSACLTPEGVRICGGTNEQCGWVGPEACPGGGCGRPYDRLLGAEAVGGVCFSDLSDNASRACWGCEDGEACIERKPGELMCVPENVCAALWQIGVRGVCRYADLSAYDGRPLVSLSSCPNASPKAELCGGPCKNDCASHSDPCSGRSPDHPQGFCFTSVGPCSLGGSGYTLPCVWAETELCGVFSDPEADAPIARQYGQCLGYDYCLALSAALPGGYVCYDKNAQIVPP